jgi:hypothetical protein
MGLGAQPSAASPKAKRVMVVQEIRILALLEIPVIQAVLVIQVLPAE